MHLKKEMRALIEKTDEEKCNCVKQKRSTDDNLMLKLKGSKNRVMITIILSSIAARQSGPA